MGVNGQLYGARAPAEQLTVLVGADQMGPLLATADALRITVRNDNDVAASPEVQCSP